MVNRVGTFFILLGLFLIGLYIMSDLTKQAICNLLIFGGAFLSLGIFMWFRDPAKPGPPTERFRILRNTGKKSEKAKK